MTNSKIKLLQLLSSFTPEEFKEFEKFIISPYINRGRNLRLLYRALKKYYPNLSDLNQEIIFKALYPDKKFSKQAYNLLSTLMSEMSNLGERFIYESHKNEPKEYYYTLAEREIQLGLKYFAKKNLDRLEHLLNDEKIDLELFYWQQKLYEEKLNYNIFFLEPDQMTESLKNRDINFCIYSVMYMVDLYTSIKSCENNFNTIISPAILLKFLDALNIDVLLESISKLTFKNKSILEMYLYLLKVEKNYRDELSYHKFRELHLKNQKLLSHFENFRLYNSIVSILVQMQSLNYEKYTKELLMVFQEIVKGKYYLSTDDAILNLHTFRNFIVIGYSLKEVMWLEKLLKENINDIKQDVRGSAYNFGIAHLYFGKGKYNEALVSTKKVNPDIFLFKLDLKNLIIKIYYELQYFEELIYLIDSYKHILKLNKNVSEQKKDWNLNFTYYVTGIVKLRNGYVKIKADELEHELLKNNRVSNKLWLLDKIKELERIKL